MKDLYGLGEHHLHFYSVSDYLFKLFDLLSCHLCFVFRVLGRYTCLSGGVRQVRNAVQSVGGEVGQPDNRYDSTSTGGYGGLYSSTFQLL